MGAHRSHQTLGVFLLSNVRRRWRYRYAIARPRLHQLLAPPNTAPIREWGHIGLQTQNVRLVEPSILGNELPRIRYQGARTTSPQLYSGCSVASAVDDSFFYKPREFAHSQCLRFTSKRLLGRWQLYHLLGLF